MLKVVHVTPVFDPILGGMERFIHDLASWGKRSGLFDSKVCLVQVNRDAGPTQYEIDGIPVRRLPKRPYQALPDMGEYVRGADVIHLHDPRLSGIVLHFARHQYGIPTVLSTHGGMFHTKRHSLLKQAYFRLVGPRLLSKLERVIASSDSDASVWSSVTTRLTTIENPMNFDLFHAAAARRPEQPASIVYFGRLARNKGLDQLIAAIANLNRRGMPVSLDIVGQDSDKLLEGLRRQVEADNVSQSVHFHGPLSDKRLLNVLGRCRFFASASRYEGFGLAAVEAMAAARVPLLSAIPPFKALVKDGEDGYLIDFGDAENAASKISEIIQQPSSTLENVALRAVERARGYGWANRIEGFMKAYELAIEMYEARHP